MEMSCRIKGLRALRQYLVECGHATDDLWISALDASIADPAADELVSVTLPRQDWVIVCDMFKAGHWRSAMKMRKFWDAVENSLDKSADIG